MMTATFTATSLSRMGPLRLDRKRPVPTRRGLLLDPLEQRANLAVHRQPATGQIASLPERQVRVGERQASDRFLDRFEQMIPAIAELDPQAHRPQDFQVAIEPSNAEPQLLGER